MTAWEKFVLSLEAIGAIIALAVILFSLFMLLLCATYKLGWTPWQPLLC